METMLERLQSEPSDNARKLMATLLLGKKSESEHVSVRRVVVLVKNPKAYASHGTSGLMRSWLYAKGGA